MRLSVTLIEAFRLLETQDWMTYEKFAEQVRGEFEPTDKVIRGLAMHDILEAPDRYYVEGSQTYMSRGVAFTRDSILAALGLLNPEPGLRELKVEQQIAGHTVVGKCDWLLGTLVRDYKLTSAVRPDGYFESYQWRLYLRLFACQTMEYWVFTAREKRRGSGVWELCDPGDIGLFRMHPYPGIVGDCERLVGRCARFLEQNGLADYVREKVAA